MKRLIVTTMMLVLVAVGAAHGQSGGAKDGVVATVNGEEIAASPSKNEND